MKKSCFLLNKLDKKNILMNRNWIEYIFFKYNTLKETIFIKKKGEYPNRFYAICEFY